MNFFSCFQIFFVLHLVGSLAKSKRDCLMQAVSFAFRFNLIGFIYTFFHEWLYCLPKSRNHHNPFAYR